IAKKYGVSVQELKKLNNLDRRSVLRVGARLSIPVDEGGIPGARVSPSSALRKPGGSKSRLHIVKRGENLQKIAHKYSVSLDKIKRANNLKTPHLVAGAKLTIPFL
ncbi:MAG: LysM peptidoglycan-binding domain-containing protein, partial [Bdellovibrio sp.]